MGDAIEWIHYSEGMEWMYIKDHVRDRVAQLHPGHPMAQ